MTSNFRMPMQIAACIAVVTLVAITAAIAIGLTHPEPVSSGALGPDWQCTRLALVFTSCTRIAAAKAASVAGARGPSCPRRPLALGMAAIGASQ
jgi:hypothetical protein